VAVDPSGLQWTYQDSWQALPNVPGIEAAILELTEERQALSNGQLQAKRDATSGAIHQEFDWEVLVRDYWRPLLVDVLEQINKGGNSNGGT
jgi:hypothetical protein